LEEKKNKARLVISEYLPKYLSCPDPAERQRIKSDAVQRAMIASDLSLDSTSLTRMWGGAITNTKRWKKMSVNGQSSLASALSDTSTISGNVPQVNIPADGNSRSPDETHIESASPQMKSPNDYEDEAPSLPKPGTYFDEESGHYFVVSRVSGDMVQLFNVWRKVNRYEGGLSRALVETLEEFFRVRKVRIEYEYKESLLYQRSRGHKHTGMYYQDGKTWLF
jgi:hypothetical protein